MFVYRFYYLPDTRHRTPDTGHRTPDQTAYDQWDYIHHTKKATITEELAKSVGERKRSVGQYKCLKRMQWLPILLLSITLQTQSALGIGKKVSPSFPQTVIINLPRSTLRRAHMTTELSRHSVPFRWMDAVDGREDPVARDNACTTPLGRWFMTPGMIGCFLSHRKCWQLCVDRGKPLLVFEDDVVLQDDFRSIVSNAMKTLEELEEKGGRDNKYTVKWDVLLLVALGCVHPQKRKFGFNWNSKSCGWEVAKYTPCRKSLKF